MTATGREVIWNIFSFKHKTCLENVYNQNTIYICFNRNRLIDRKQNIYIYIPIQLYIEMNHFSGYQKLAHYKSNILQ